MDYEKMWNKLKETLSDYGYIDKDEILELMSEIEEEAEYE